MARVQWQQPWLFGLFRCTRCGTEWNAEQLGRLALAAITEATKRSIIQDGIKQLARLYGT